MMSGHAGLAAAAPHLSRPRAETVPTSEFETVPGQARDKWGRGSSPYIPSAARSSVLAASNSCLKSG
jgi:hypothetical protein